MSKESESFPCMNSLGRMRGSIWRWKCWRGGESREADFGLRLIAFVTEPELKQRIVLHSAPRARADFTGSITTGERVRRPRSNRHQHYETRTRRVIHFDETVVW